MLIFLVSLFSRLSGELLPLCDLPWEFNSNCDHTSTDKMRAHTQQSAWRDAGRFIQDFFSGLKRAEVSGSRKILSSSSVQTKTSFHSLNVPLFSIKISLQTLRIMFLGISSSAELKQMTPISGFYILRHFLLL